MRSRDHRCWWLLPLTAICLAALAEPSSAKAYRTLAELEGSLDPIILPRVLFVYVDGTALPAAEREMLERETAAAVVEWTQVPCARPMLAYGGPGTGAADAVRIVVTDEWASAEEGIEAVGTTELVLESGPDGGARIVAATIYVNGTVTWGTHPQSNVDDALDLRVVILHELGHVLGLAHSDDADATMYASYEGSAQAVLDADDTAGVCALYPLIDSLPRPTCQTSQDCYAGERCRDSFCVEESRFGAPCTSGDACRAELCVDTASGGQCTYACAHSTECPSGTHCISTNRADLSVCAPLSSEAVGCSSVPAAPGGAPALLQACALLLLLTIIRTKRLR